MNTKTQDTEKNDGPSEVEHGHIHGPNCNHGHSHARPAPVTRETPKVGRNDDCPCGSKMKFKKCCGK